MMLSAQKQKYSRNHIEVTMFPLFELSIAFGIFGVVMVWLYWLERKKKERETEQRLKRLEEHTQ